MAKKTTIHDVAKLANVSVTTVSLALSGKGRISQATVEKINQAIKELNYIRNKNAATLRSGQSKVIGVVVKDIYDSFYGGIVSGLHEVLTNNDYMLFLTQAGSEEKDLLKCVHSLISQDVSGIVLCETYQHLHTIQQLAKRRNIPVMLVAQSVAQNNFNIIHSNNNLGAVLATEHLIHKGHRQIAYLGGHNNSLTRAERLEGFGRTLTKFGLKFRSEWILDQQQLEDTNRYDNFLKQNPNITAFLCHDTKTTLSLFFSASKLGCGIGKGALNSYLERDIEIFSFGSQKDLLIAKDIINYVDNQAIELGRAAASALLQEHPTLIDIEIEPQLITY